MSFASWYEPGKPIPVMNPVPWVYAEVYFPHPEEIEWRVRDYKNGTYTVERYTLSEESVEDIPEE